VVIKDGFDTLKAQLLKREKRKFVIGFVSEKNTKHDIHVIFNEMPIKGKRKFDSKFFKISYLIVLYFDL